MTDTDTGDATPQADDEPAVVVAERFDPNASVSDLIEHPDNPRRGNVDLLVQSIKANGFYGSVIAQESTGYVLVGNHRLRAAREAGIEQVPVMWVDVDDQQARRIMLIDNRSSDQADYDASTLAALLESTRTDQGDLTGTGYDDTDLSLILAAATPPEPTPPTGGFPAVDPNALDLQHTCPRCGYEW